MSFRRTTAGRTRALAVLGGLIVLPLSVLVVPAGADSPGAANAAAPTETTPKTTPGNAPRQSPKPGSLGRARPVLVYEKVKYESLLSVNDQCPVRGGKLNSGIRPVYVNRHPVGFC